jgi:hypothetical protein
MSKPLIWTRRGVAEIELLRRYGRLKVGTRATIPFRLEFKEIVVMEGKDVGQYELIIDGHVANDPRRLLSYKPIGWLFNKTNWFFIPRRGESFRFQGDVFDYALVSAETSLESRTTDSKQQRFRVLSVTWQDPRPADHPEPAQDPA